MPPRDPAEATAAFRLALRETSRRVARYGRLPTAEARERALNLAALRLRYLDREAHRPAA